MKKNILLLLMFAFLFTACNTSTNGANKTEMAKEYFPIAENVVYEYTNEDNPYMNYKVFNSFIQDNKVQQKFISDFSITDSVIEVTDDEVKLYYGALNNYFFQNNIDKEPTDDIYILKGPIKKQTKWISPTGESQITAVDVDVNVSFGNYKAIEITSKVARQGEEEIVNYTLKDYFAKDIGLIKSIQIDEDGKESITELSNFAQNASEQVNFTLYRLDDQAEKLEPMEASIIMKTNDIGAEAFETVFKSEEAKLFTPNVKINSLTVSEDERDLVVRIDLSKEYITEMNAGSGTEGLLLQALTDTLCHYSGAKKIHLTIDGANYEGGHILLGDGEYLIATE